MLNLCKHIKYIQEKEGGERNMLVYAMQCQIYCCECGSKFALDPIGEPVGPIIPVRCPIGHDRGSCVYSYPHGDYKIPVEMDIFDRYKPKLGD